MGRLISMTLPQYRRHECTIVVKLRPAMSELLANLLVSPPDRFVSKETLIQALWADPDVEPGNAESIVRRDIHFLRRLGVPIQSHIGFGWRIPADARLV